MTEDKKIPLAVHLNELKKRFFISFLFFIFSVVVSYIYVEQIFYFLLEPLSNIIGAAGSRKIIFTSLTEAFFTYLKLSIFSGFILSFPFIMTQVYAFIAPGLYKNEKKVILPFLIAAPLLFILGAALVYYFIFPLAWQFFLGFETIGTKTNLPIQLEAKISEYLSLVSTLIIAFGLAFQLPILLVFLVKLGVIDSIWLKAKRKMAIILSFIVAAILTPPDVISQIGLAIPLLLLYELSIIAAKYIEKKE